jgi:hypothetical protein
MARRSRNLMALVEDYVVDAVERPTSSFATRSLSGLKCEVMLHHSEALLQQLIVYNACHLSSLMNCDSSISLIDLRQCHNFHQCVWALVCVCVSGDRHSVPFNHL